MDLDEFRTILSKSRADVWGIIDAAITVSSLEHGDELKHRRDGIIEKLYLQCRNCDVNHCQQQPQSIQIQTAAAQPEETKTRAGDMKNNNNCKVGDESPLTPQSNHRDDDDNINNNNVNNEQAPDPFGGLFDDDDEQTRILTIKEQLEDPNQPEDSVVELLQGLADMDLTFKTLKETDIGRHVNRFRKHSSNEVRRLVKQLVRKWKELVDEWVGSNNTDGAPANLIADGDSPLLHNVPPWNLQNQNGHHHQVPDFGYSPNPHNGSSGSERNTNSEPEQRPKSVPNNKREAPSRPPPQSLPRVSASAPPPNRARKESSIDLDRLASARRRLHENYQEAENAKKQRTIQVMDIHEIPKPKNGFIAKNKGGGFQGRHHR